MRPLLFSPPRCAGWLLLTFLAVAGRPAAAADPLDPVLQLANVLDKDINPENRADIQRQKELLETHVKSLTRPSELRDALFLPGWKRRESGDQPGEDDPLGKIYQEFRSQLADRLAKTLRSGLTADGDAHRRLAAVTFLAEMARAESEAEQGSFPLANRFRNMMPRGPVIRFTPRMAGDLRKVLANDKDPDVCATAARAAVEIAPAEAATLDALKPLLQTGRKIVERRAAAEGLDRMFEVLVNPPQQRPLPIIQVGSRIVSAAGLGLGDKDAAIRRLCLQTFQQAVQQIQKALGNIREVPEMARDARQLQQSLAVYRPLAAAVNEQMAAVVNLLTDSDLAVRLSAHQVLENLAGAQRGLWELFPPPLPPPGEDELPLPEERELGKEKPKAKPDKKGATKELPRHEPMTGPFNFDGILKALPALKKNLADEEVRIRLASLYVLETLGGAAAPAVEEITKALADKNGFVRWGAARVLNNMAPLASDKVVPALAEALSDENKTVRLSAVAALQRYGSEATAAVKPLAKAIADPEPRMRIGAINALASIGAKARPESGALVQALKDKTPAVRAAAAKALAQMGRLDAETVKALHKALSDPEAAVRRAVSDTLLDDHTLEFPRGKE